ncbi:MAG: PAS domain S-box protein, partial [Deltaproteobacteria bacterium]|nr:PAS domain S-box protein [Deltaproteobacteria bacterium]
MQPSGRVFIFLIAAVLYGLLSAVLFEAPSAVAGQTLVLAPDNDSYSLASHMEILEDKDNNLTIEDVSSARLAKQFAPYQKGIISPTRSALWFRFTISDPRRPTGPPASFWRLFLSEMYSDNTTLYFPETASSPEDRAVKWQAVPAGMILDPVLNSVIDVLPAPHLPADLTRPTTIYVRIQSLVFVYPNFEICTDSVYRKKAARANRLLGLTHGILLTLLIYNLILYFSKRDLSRLYYALFTGSALLFLLAISRLLYQAFPSIPLKYLCRVIPLSVGLFYVFCFLFARTFLTTWKNSPFLDRVLIVGAIANLGLCGLALWGHQQLILRISILFSLICPIAPIAAGVIRWRQGYRPARFFLVAWLLILLNGLAPNSLALSRLLPYQELILSIFEASIILQPIFLSLALVDQTNQRGLDKDKAFDEITLLHEKIKKSEKRYRLLMENSPDAITVYDQAGQAIYINPAFQRIYGWSPEELMGRRIDFIPPHEEEKTREAVARNLAGETTQIETQRINKSGGLIDVSIKSVVLGDIGENVSALLVIHRDITEQKRAERTLRESAEQFRIMIEESPLGISIMSVEGVFKYINPKFIEIFGYKLSEIHTGQEWLNRAFPDPDIRKQVLSLWKEHKQT